MRQYNKACEYLYGELLRGKYCFPLRPILSSRVETAIIRTVTLKHFLFQVSWVYPFERITRGECQLGFARNGPRVESLEIGSEVS